VIINKSNPKKIVSTKETKFIKIKKQKPDGTTPKFKIDRNKPSIIENDWLDSRKRERQKNDNNNSYNKNI